ncbi:Glutamyl-Q tRNA(Asp) synthetase [Sinobacterium norvegicum]|uniref:Glutamyl-Q tRNA(Asp) synthetase n=1 Tax=Sinobacterium norvegicum TaxID=1641715 RepID=A0ABN8EJK0_9GAMM|nr:tRNA glutamyl-Q(34) synthetase GluQRS [Sinobacterium norvegicum]CAH0992254.1 Glutamyl-Q tRNA(Asp) synthetase [Sinobacterium norvegicum]
MTNKHSQDNDDSTAVIPPYVGRFAPSPTGPLHMGSLISALASFLDARAHQGEWLIRVEDIDPPREIAGASENIIASLSAHGLHSDRPILFQHSRLDAYQAALQTLQRQQLCFRCQCSRTQLKGSDIYPGHCRYRTIDDSIATATRLLVDQQPVSYCDRIQGPRQQNLAAQLGDFVIARKDGLISYQLAVVVDDAFQGVTHIVRGADLLESTERQIYLGKMLDYPSIDYAHLPVLTNEAGQKLSKQTFAPSLDSGQIINNLLFALSFLNQTLPERPPKTVEQLLEFAIQHWDIDAIAKHCSHYQPLPSLA